MFKAWNTWEEIYFGDTIDYGVKSLQVKITTVERTSLQLKGIYLNSHRNERWHGQRLCDSMKQT